MTELEIQKAKFEFVEARKNEWLDGAWVRAGRELELKVERWERAWKREKPTGPEFCDERRRFYESQIEEIRAEIDRLVEIQEPRWEAQFDEEHEES